MLKKLGTSAIKKALPTIVKTGKGVFDDVTSGKSFKKSIMKRSRNAGTELMNTAFSAAKDYLNTDRGPSPRKRRRTTQGARRAGGRKKSAGREKATLF